MPSHRRSDSATLLIRPLSRLVALGAVVAVTGSCLNDRSLTPPASSLASIVVAAEQMPGGPDLGLTTARVVLRPDGIYGDSVVATGPWTGDSAIIQTPVSIVSTSQFFDVVVGVVNARGDTLLRGTSRIRLYSLFTISTRLALTYSGVDANLSTLQILPRDTVVAAGGVFTARVIGTDAAGHAVSPIFVAWTSRNPSLFTVDAAGQVTAQSTGGTAYIVATTFAGKKDSTTITVRTGITSTVVTPQSATLHALTNTQALTATAYMGTAPTSGAFTWTSRTPAVATVSAAGLVTAVSNGTAYIVAVEAGGTKDSSLITVRQDVATLAIAPPSATIMLGQTKQFTVTATDAAGFPVTNLAAADYIWDTSDHAVATVDASGLATSHALGGPINVTVAAGGKSASAQLTVANNVASVVVTPSPLVCDALGQQRIVTATAYDAASQVVGGVTFTWQIVGSAVITLGGGSASTNTVTCIAVGNTSITATSQGVVSAAVPVTVRQLIDHITILPSAVTIAIGAQQTFTASAFDLNNNAIPGLGAGAFVWASSDQTIATVTAAGVATGVAAGGPVNISAAAGGKVGLAPLIVRSNIARIAITPDTTTFDAIGRTRTLTATAYDASNAVVSVASFTWVSSSPSVASLATGTSSGSNVVTANDNGATAITATAQGVTSPNAPVTVLQVIASLEVKPSTGEPATLAPGGKIRMFARGKDALGVYMRLPVTITSWQSDDATDLPVDANGVVTGNQEEIVVRGNVAASISGITGHISATATGPSGPITSNQELVTLTGGATKQITWERDTLFLASGSATVHLYVNVPSAAPINTQFTYTPSQGAPVPVAVPIGANEFTITVGTLPPGTYALTVTDTNPIVANRYAGSTMTVVVGSTSSQLRLRRVKR